MKNPSPPSPGGQDVTAGFRRTTGCCGEGTSAPVRQQGGFLSYRGTPSHHPFIDWIFHEIDHPAIGISPFQVKTPYSSCNPSIKIKPAMSGWKRCVLFCLSLREEWNRSGDDGGDEATKWLLATQLEK